MRRRSLHPAFPLLLRRRLQRKPFRLPTSDTAIGLGLVVFALLLWLTR